VANTDASADNVGQKWSLTALKKALREGGIDEASIWKKIEDIIIKTLLSAESSIFSSFE
jgi:tubulin polyglutamylase TTLL5